MESSSAGQRLERNMECAYSEIGSGMLWRRDKLQGNGRLFVCKYLSSEYDRKESAGHGLSAWRRKCVGDSQYRLFQICCGGESGCRFG